MIPVPGYTISTPYGQRGPYWSCDRDAKGYGIHTGADYAAPKGTPVVAARPGRLEWCNHGSAFGNHQIEVVCDDGTRDFYAHLSSRVAEGPARAGERVGAVGSEGNATGPHLHFERHATTSGGWSCSVVRDPQPSIAWAPAEEDDMPSPKDWSAEDWKAFNSHVADSVWLMHQDVTLPSGKKEAKSMKQIVRETWQRVAKAGG